MFVPNLEIVTSIGGELWHAQAQNGVNFDFGVQFDLEGHNQSSHKTIGLLTKVFYISGPNLVIIASTVDELSRGQTRDWRTHGHTHTHTHAGNDNTRRPKLASGKNEPCLNETDFYHIIASSSSCHHLLSSVLLLPLLPHRILQCTQRLHLDEHTWLRVS